MEWLILNQQDMNNNRRHDFGYMMRNSAVRCWNTANGWGSAGLATIFTESEHTKLENELPADGMWAILGRYGCD